MVQAWSPQGLATEPGNHDFGTDLDTLRLAAMVALDTGDTTTARSWLELHDRWLAWSGGVLGRADGYLGWSAYHRATGKEAMAREHGEMALAHATEPRQPLALLAAHRLLGELAIAAERHADARAQLNAALALADACAAPYERALTLLALAELHLSDGRWVTAREVLAEAHAILTRLGADPALARCAALAARLGEEAPTATATDPPAQPAHYPARLTAREVEVLRLVAAGRSNREVAATFCRSERTIERHLENIYRKIAARNRADATAFALRHRLA